MHGQDKFIHLYQQHYEALYFFARQFVFDREECHDIVSSVFEEIWRDLASVREETARSASTICGVVSAKKRILNM